MLQCVRFTMQASQDSVDFRLLKLRPTPSPERMTCWFILLKAHAKKHFVRTTFKNLFYQLVYVWILTFLDFLNIWIEPSWMPMNYSLGQALNIHVYSKLYTDDYLHSFLIKNHVFLKTVILFITRMKRLILMYFSGC